MTLLKSQKKKIIHTIANPTDRQITVSEFVLFLIMIFGRMTFSPLTYFFTSSLDSFVTYGLAYPTKYAKAAPINSTITQNGNVLSCIPAPPSNAE